MADRALTVRFFVARKSVSDGSFKWPATPILRALLQPALPGIGKDGVPAKHDGETYLVETAAYDAKTALHVQIARDLDEVPAVRQNQRTGPLRLAVGQVPASVSHLTFLPGGVVAVVRGVTSPGPHQSAAILSDATGVPFRLEPLTRTDQLQALNNSTGATTVEYTATVVDPAVAAGDSVLEATRRLTGQQDFEITLRVTARGQGGRVSLRRLARKLIDGQMSGNIKLTRGTAKLTGASRMDARVIDLLDDQIVEKRVVRLPVPPGQQLATLSALDVLSEVRTSYNGLLVVIGSALAATPTDFPG